MDNKYFLIRISETKDGKLKISSRNYGFTPLELIGLLHYKMDDIRAQMKGQIKPDIIERKLVKGEIDDTEGR
jgi:hypothetical protein